LIRILDLERTDRLFTLKDCNRKGTTMSLTKLNHLVRDTRGANMVEYIILVGVVAILAMAGFKIFGSQINTKINQQGDTVGSVQGS